MRIQDRKKIIDHGNAYQEGLENMPKTSSNILKIGRNTFHGVEINRKNGHAEIDDYVNDQEESKYNSRLFQQRDQNEFSDISINNRELNEE